MGAKYKAIWKDGTLLAEYENGVLTYLNPEYSAAKRSDTVKAPMYMRDIGAYVSPLDGTRITSRSQHREHMRVHDVIEVGTQKIGSLAARAENENMKSDRALGEAIKRRLEEVKALPQAQYDAHVRDQQCEHEAIASLVTATTEAA